MTRHPLDGSAIAADAHYGREEPEMQPCDQCDGEGWWWEYGIVNFKTVRRKKKCHVCGGSGGVPVEQEEPEAQERDE